MARKTIKIKSVTNKPDEFSKQLNTLKDEHVRLGADSPLAGYKDIDMDNFSIKLTAADLLRKKSEGLRKQSEDLMQQAKTIYGTATGQNIGTKDTLYYTFDTIKKALLKAYKGNEAALGNFGIDVTIGQAKGPSPKLKKD